MGYESRDSDVECHAASQVVGHAQCSPAKRGVDFGLVEALEDCVMFPFIREAQSECPIPVHYIVAGGARIIVHPHRIHDPLLVEGFGRGPRDADAVLLW